MISKILVPMDGSRKCQKALEYAGELAGCTGAEVLILRVVTISMLNIAWAAPSSGGPVIKRDFLKEAERKDRKLMARIRRYLRGKEKALTARGVNASTRLMVGDPADSIKECCKKEKVNLIIMTSHGKGWFKRAIMGSVTDEILRTSKVPVLVIRSK